jgi:hypothetical protein
VNEDVALVVYMIAGIGAIFCEVVFFMECVEHSFWQGALEPIAIFLSVVAWMGLSWGRVKP